MLMYPLHMVLLEEFIYFSSTSCCSFLSLHAYVITYIVHGYQLIMSSVLFIHYKMIFSIPKFLFFMYSVSLTLNSDLSAAHK